jgi:putative oxidoreductase
MSQEKCKTTESHEVAWQRWGMFYLRIALGVSFLSGIADRFGLYTGRNVGYGNFAGFMRYTAQVNSFMP